MRRRTARRKNSAGRGCVLARMRERHRAQAEFIKDADEMKIIAERLRAFHREKQADSSFASRSFDIRKRAAKHQARIRVDLRFDQRDLIKRNAERVGSEMLVFNVNRDTEQRHITCFELCLKFLRDHVLAIAMPEKIERQIEVHVDQSAAMQPRNVRVEFGHVEISCKISRAAASLASFWPSFAITFWKLVSISSRCVLSASRRNTSVAISSGRALCWMNSGTISRSARTFGMPRCLTITRRRPAA